MGAGVGMGHHGSGSMGMTPYGMPPADPMGMQSHGYGGPHGGPLIGVDPLSNQGFGGPPSPHRMSMQQKSFNLGSQDPSKMGQMDGPNPNGGNMTMGGPTPPHHKQNPNMGMMSPGMHGMMGHHSTQQYVMGQPPPQVQKHSFIGGPGQGGP